MDSAPDAYVMALTVEGEAPKPAKVWSRKALLAEGRGEAHSIIHLCRGHRYVLVMRRRSWNPPAGPLVDGTDHLSVGPST